MRNSTGKQINCNRYAPKKTRDKGKEVPIDNKITKKNINHLKNRCYLDPNYEIIRETRILTWYFKKYFQGLPWWHNG